MHKPLTDLDSASRMKSSETDHFSTKSLQSFEFVELPKYIQKHLDKQKHRQLRLHGGQTASVHNIETHSADEAN